MVISRRPPLEVLRRRTAPITGRVPPMAPAATAEVILPRPIATPPAGTYNPAGAGPGNAPYRPGGTSDYQPINPARSIAQSGQGSEVQATTYEASPSASATSALPPTGSNATYPAASTYPSAVGNDPAGANNGSIYTAGGSGMSVGGSASGGAGIMR